MKCAQGGGMVGRIAFQLIQRGAALLIQACAAKHGSKRRAACRQHEGGATQYPHLEQQERQAGRRALVLKWPGGQGTRGGMRHMEDQRLGLHEGA